MKDVRINYVFNFKLQNKLTCMIVCNWYAVFAIKYLFQILRLMSIKVVHQ